MKAHLPRLCFSAALLLACGPSIPVRFPHYPSSTGTQLRAVLDGKKTVGIVAARPPQNMLQQIGYQEDWSRTVEAAVETEIVKREFYTLVDLSSRAERLRELAHSQSGLTQESLAIGRELQASHLLVISMTNQPRSECTIQNRTDLMATALNLAMAASNDGQGAGAEEKPTAVMTVTVFVQGRLINVETGQSVSYATSTPAEHYNSVGDTNCPSVLAAFNNALQQAAKDLADNLSPRSITLDVPLMDDVDDVDEEDQEAVTDYLNSGNEWAEAADFERASRSWQRALTESRGQSVSAMWNLAVYNWYRGNYGEAENLFNRALDSAGPSWLDGAKRELISAFNEDRCSVEGGPGCN